MFWAGLPTRLFEKNIFCDSSRFTSCIVFHIHATADSVTPASLSAEESFLRAFSCTVPSARNAFPSPRRHSGLSYIRVLLTLYFKAGKSRFGKGLLVTRRVRRPLSQPSAFVAVSATRDEEWKNFMTYLWSGSKLETQATSHKSIS